MVSLTITFSIIMITTFVITMVIIKVVITYMYNIYIYIYKQPIACWLPIDCLFPIAHSLLIAYCLFLDAHCHDNTCKAFLGTLLLPLLAPPYQPQK